MKKTQLFCLILAAWLLAVPLEAERADYCFKNQDLGEDLEGICLQQLPREGVLMLGNRVLRPGDVLTARQIEDMTYYSEGGGPGEISYLPVSRQGVLETASFLIPGRKNQAPIAEDSALETYKNLPNSGLLRVRDPEQKDVTVTLVREPRRGTVTLGDGGKFTYTPKKNKVGTDFFIYEAVDPEGNVSRQATVTVTILKPTEAPQYRDTGDLDCSFSAEWMKNTGIFTAENVGDACCFQPQKPVSRGEFLPMLLKTLQIPPEPELTANLKQLPLWLRPYGAAALRSGLTAGLRELEDPEAPISGEEAAVMIQNALELPVPAVAPGEGLSFSGASALAALGEAGISLKPREALTRADTAELLYRVHLLKTTS